MSNEIQIKAGLKCANNGFSEDHTVNVYNDSNVGANMISGVVTLTAASNVYLVPVSNVAISNPGYSYWLNHSSNAASNVYVGFIDTAVFYPYVTLNSGEAAILNLEQNPVIQMQNFSGPDCLVEYCIIERL